MCECFLNRKKLGVRLAKLELSRTGASPQCSLDIPVPRLVFLLLHANRREGIKYQSSKSFFVSKSKQFI
jgi:hypothetical protein